MEDRHLCHGQLEQLAGLGAKLVRLYHRGVGAARQDVAFLDERADKEVAKVWFGQQAVLRRACSTGVCALGCACAGWRREARSILICCLGAPARP